MGRFHLPPRSHRSPDGAHDRDHLTAPKGGAEPRLRGRLDPSEMFPAGRSDIRARMVVLRSGLSLRVAESGDAAAPVVLLVHGWGASLYMWRDWFAPLAAAGRRVIAIDLPGHGLSDKPDGALHYRVESMLGVLRELMETEDLRDVDLVAQSMAGTIALELMTKQESRVRRLVLVNPACFGRVRQERLLQFASPSLIDVFLPRLVARWIVANTHRLVYGDPSRITRRDEDEYWAPSQFPSYARAMRRLLHEFRWARPPVREMAERLEGIGGRVLVVLGSRDRVVLDSGSYVTELSACVSGLEVEILEGAGHAVNEERAKEVIARVLRFFR